MGRRDRISRGSAVAIGVAIAVLSGCSPLGAPAAGPTQASRAGSQTSATGPTSSPLATAQATHEYPSPLPPAQTVNVAGATPEQAIRAFADTYINWTAQTVAGQMRSLARASVGQARSAMELAAAQTAQDYELQRGGIANSGRVEAIAPLLGHRDEYAVVTRELTSASATTAYQGLRPAWHLALATVVALAPGQWVLNRWQPQN